MKRIFFPGMIAFCGLLLSVTGFSQAEKKPITKSEEIIIRTDGNNNTKTIIEIDSNEVTVNGQPLIRLQRRCENHQEKTDNR